MNKVHDEIAMPEPYLRLDESGCNLNLGQLGEIIRELDFIGDPIVYLLDEVTDTVRPVTKIILGTDHDGEISVFVTPPNGNSKHHPFSKRKTITVSVPEDWEPTEHQAHLMVAVEESDD